MTSVQCTVDDDYSMLVKGTAPEALSRHRQDVCCAERYDSSFIRNVPKSVIDADFGCGNPTRYLRAGDVVLDIGCGAGMNCYVAAQIVGPEGRVIGVDYNEDMLAVARGAQPEFDRQGKAPMRFLRAGANDLALDLEWSGNLLAGKPVRTVAELQRYNAALIERRRDEPAIPSSSVDVVISNCVINLVDDVDKPAVFREIARVLKPGGRFAISDNVSNRPVPADLKVDRTLWSACYAGVLQEQDFYAQLEAAGFVNIKIEVRNPDPAHRVDDLVFYSITVTGERPSSQVAAVSVMYRGPLRAIVGDSGKVYQRGIVEVLAKDDAHVVNSLDEHGFLLVSGAVPVQTAADFPTPAASACCC